MTAPDPVPPVDRPLADAVAVLLRLTLDDIGPAVPDQERAADQTVDLLAQADTLGGEAALFELAVACAAVIAPPGGNQRTGGAVRLTHHGYGPDMVAGAPSTTAQYLVQRFITAVLDGDRPACWRVWRQVMPPGIGPDDDMPQALGDFLGLLVRNAWSRHHGGGLLIDMGPGDPADWPPECDFCAAPAAARWMWHADDDGQPIDVGAHMTDRCGPVLVRITDAAHWYGCDGCRPYLVRPKIDWAAVWARHRRQRPGADHGRVMAVLRVFGRTRKGRYPVPLPDQRPAPPALG